VVRFDAPIDSQLEELGTMPTPPYITVPLESKDEYQTVFARDPGSAAAPTAGLHFTPDLLDHIRSQNVEVVEVTLHIGLDTFAPVRVSDPRKHRIHTEWCQLHEESAQEINDARQRGGRVVAVGTTTVRTLETAAQFAEPGAIVAPFEGPTDLFIMPGFQFQAVDVLITNFHLPRSTLLMLVSAFAGRERILAAYERAIARGYRFYSFGDAMLIL
jgi:S-adenosylmethionine:tRNA ribosyltransferase-isomerase